MEATVIACWKSLGDERPPFLFDLRWFVKIASTVLRCLAKRNWLRWTLLILWSGEEGSLIEYIIEDLGISRSLVSTLCSLGTLVGSFTLPF
jgi:hypothetical protein